MKRLLLLLLLCGCRRGQSIHEPDFSLDRMMQQPSLRPYDESDSFADRAAMRTPPPGTLPAFAETDPAIASGSIDGAPVAKIPVPVDRALLARGREKFEIVCAACHGILGDGDSAAARNMPLRKPRSLHDDEVMRAKAGEIFAVISRGYGLMPALAPYLGVRDRWAVVAYVRALNRSQHATAASLPPHLRERLGS